jgi:1,4-dihydroxy-2-naphthoate octaprenyltransferase
MRSEVFFIIGLLCFLWAVTYAPTKKPIASHVIEITYEV